MARIRYLKMGFFENEDLALLSAHHRLCFEGLWLLSDKAGRLEDRPKRIHARLFPYESDLDVSLFLHDLAAKHFIARYAVGDLRLIQVLNFLEHQRPRHDEPPSVLPAQPIDALGRPLDHDATVQDPILIATPPRTPAEVLHEHQLTVAATDRTLDRRESPPGMGIGMGIGTGTGMGEGNAPPILSGLDSHRKHACCGVVCLHTSQFEQFLQRASVKPGVDPQLYVRNFFREWNTRYTVGDRAGTMVGADMFDFWRDRWKETHPEVKAPAVDLAAKAAELVKRDQARWGTK